jgi:NTE family protein
MGADRVVAINVGDLSDRQAISYTLLGLAGATLDAMMRSSTKDTIGQADVVIDVPLHQFGSLDWRRSAELIDAGYRAADAMRDRLLPLAVSEDEYARWRQARQRERRTGLPNPTFVEVAGFSRNDTRRLNAVLPKHVGVALDVPALEKDLAELTGLDRYETITWQMATNDCGDTGIRVTARLKPYAPPFMMLGLNLDNTTATDFRVNLSARYLAYGAVTSGSELRVDGTLGSYPALGVELYEPLRATSLFAAPYATIETDTAESRSRDLVIAKYGITTSRVGLNVGTNLGRRSDLRAGVFAGWVDAGLEIGDPRLPELRGRESGLQLQWRFDGQDSPVVPSGGTLATARWLRVFNGPDGVLEGQSIPLDNRLRQFSATANRFWSLGARNRVFAYGGFGTSFDQTADPTYKFVLGTPMRLGAFHPGELRASNYYVATGGYLRQMARLPDFLGGPVFAGGWLENGDAFEDFDQATWRSNATAGVIMETLLGPVIVAGSAGFDGRWRTYIGVGRVFR